MLSNLWIFWNKKMQLKEYVETYGIKQAWLAKQIGINRRALNYVLMGHRRLPRKYWTKLILITEGKINIEDLEKLEKLHAKFKIPLLQSRKSTESGGDSELSAQEDQDG